MLETGKSAPDFCSVADDGETICLGNLREKWVVLYFYSKDNTSG